MLHKLVEAREEVVVARAYEDGYIYLALNTSDLCLSLGKPKHLLREYHVFVPIIKIVPTGNLVVYQCIERRRISGCLNQVGQIFFEVLIASRKVEEFFGEIHVIHCHEFRVVCH